ncbi:hypothetical protein GGTG_13244 [Gaeumannomyces tritici R3-111a-1]|uniref:Uncharacterized protein n=1 Tax=Gaeumannomyces tritici (strain R3-111a-1) TaxID=644352 RepID=J3PIB6_GAET3|nr:hypothetical protein GGTG_13244 [Gaeumannomyces tritici R3-111a-1]EJT69135.1 hypothetical protein GGTG_13244 [Gaeumannomyces tritici R3-111a-1]
MASELCPRARSIHLSKLGGGGMPCRCWYASTASSSVRPLAARPCHSTDSALAFAIFQVAGNLWLLLVQLWVEAPPAEP